MELKQVARKLQGIINKYKYAVVILIIGVILLLIPGKSTKEKQGDSLPAEQVASYSLTSKDLAEILQTIDGAGEVQVMLSVASGEKTQYISNEDISENNTRSDTVIITDADRNEAGLIERIDPPIYRGAIVVCEGADSAQVRLSITQAVSKITGLSTDNICVLKMK